MLRKLKKLLAVAGLALAGHQIMLVPHALCQSIESNTGDPVELTSDAPDDDCHQDHGIGVTEHGHHHDHCEHQLPDSSQSSGDILQAATFSHLVFECGETPVPSTFLILTSREATSATSTNHFVRHVRILS